MTCLKLLIDFLAKFEDTTGNGGKDAGAKLRTECANAISFEWSAERFEKAASTYHDDLTKIRICCAKNTPFAEIGRAISAGSGPRNPFSFATVFQSNVLQGDRFTRPG
jgi:hypothetical protein